MTEKITSSLLIHPDELDTTWINEAVQSGVTRIGLHPVGGGEAHLSLAALLTRLEDEDYRKTIDYAYESGLEIEYEMHAARFLLPAEHFPAHPEYFRMNENGERTPDKNCCATNEEALDIMAKNAVECTKKLYRSTHRYFFWLDDAKNSACHCEKCRNYTPSEQQMLILNRIIVELKKYDKDATLSYLAYADCKEPPYNVKPEDGIFLEYAPMDRDYHIPMDSPDSEKNLAQSAYARPLLEFFGKSDAKLLEYWLDNSLYSSWKKPPKKFVPDGDVIRADIRHYISLGFHDISTFACFLGYDYRELYGMPDISPFTEDIK